MRYNVLGNTGLINRLLQALGCSDGAREVAGDDARDALRRQPARQRLRLSFAASGERDLWPLDDAPSIARGFAVANQEDTRHRGSQV